MVALCWLIDTAIELTILLLIASVVLSWLVSFNIINTGNRFVYLIGDFLFRATEPLLRPVRNVLPSMGGLDISPMIAILALIFIQKLLLADLLNCR